jgi:hypothetical protein
MLSDWKNTYDGAIVPSKIATGLVRRVSDITDGTSSTLLIGEKLVDGKFAFAEGEQAAGCYEEQGYIVGWDLDAVGYATGFNERDGPLAKGVRSLPSRNN